MAGRHWNDDELIGRLYEAGPDNSHLEECEDCARRWQQLLALRARAVRPPRVSEEFLAAQRRAIYDRLEWAAGGSGHWWIGPALAAAVMVLLAVLLSRPAPEAPSSLASADAQFFTEVYSVVESTEPQAIQPIRGLFEVRQ